METRKKELQLFYKSYVERLNTLMSLADIDDLEKVITTIITAFKNDKTVFVCGNGGSAATASHMHVDFNFFVRSFTKFRPKFRAITDNVPMITAVGNDTTYDDIFVEQLRGSFEKGDVLICISASGNSENVIRAAQYANQQGGITIAFVGFSGGKLKDEAQISLFTPNPKGDYGPIEDLHMILDHIIINFIVKDKEFLSIPEKT